jgi:hypothetical protein
MENTDANHKIDARLFDTLLTPSWLSGLIAILSGLVVTVGTIIVFNLSNSPIQQQIAGWQNTRQQTTLTVPGQIVAAPQNSLQTSWPLLAFWAAIGLAVYFVVEEIISIARNTAELKAELDYVHASRQQLLRTSMTRLLIRVAAIAAWLIFIDIFSKRIIPYSLISAQAGTADLVSWNGLFYESLAFVMVALSLHAHTIFLRLVARKPRVFSSATYV